MGRTLRLEHYNKEWPQMYENEKKVIVSVVGHLIDRIEHIGSTSIPDLKAKPTIDISIGVKSLDLADKAVPLLQELGYEYRQHFEVDLPFRRYLVRARPNKEDEHLFHIHMTQSTHRFHIDHILFRNYLRRHPVYRNEYASLKLKLAFDLKDNREAYVEGKSEFVRKILKLAKSENN